MKPNYILPILLLLYLAHQFLYNMGARGTAIEGYQQCMSDEKKASAEEFKAYAEFCASKDDFDKTVCMNSRPYYNEDLITQRCKSENGLKPYVKNKLELR